MTPQAATPFTRDLTLVGGGHAHALLLRRWAMRPVPGARLTLVTPSPYAAYSGMLPGLIAGLYAPDEIFIDLVKLTRAAGARLVLARAEGLEPRRGRLLLEGRPPLDFDLASINVGAGSSAPDLADPFGRLAPVKPVEPFLAALEAAVAGGARSAAVIGAGVGGVELAFALRARLGPEARITLVGRGVRVAPSLSRASSRALAARLKAAGVALALGSAAREITRTGVVLSGGPEIPADFVAGAAGARAPEWFAQTGLELDAGGFIAVDQSLRAASDPNIFVAGDAATIVAAPREKAGVYAVRQAPLLYDSLSAALQGREPKPSRLQRAHLKLISLGDGRALAERGGWLVGGPDPVTRALWRWKDAIDRRFMSALTPDPVALRAPEPPSGAARGVTEALSRAPLCAGCGGKIGRAALLEATARLAPLGAPSVLAGPGDDAAVLRQPNEAQARVVTVDHIRAFTDDPRLFAEVAAHHAFGDVFAMGAQAEAALLAVTLPPMTPALQSRTLADALLGAEAALGAIGAALVGGHSSEGAEFAIGVTALGLAQPSAATPLDRARPGDNLYLSRPIGSGVLLAAEMRRLARGGDVAALYETMRSPSASTAAGLLSAGARAMTDVTGFGLAGHLLSLLEASGVSARLALDAIPVYPGAMALAEQGVRSSLFAENLAATADMLDIPETPLRDLLLDPQTAGGYLAALPPEAAVPEALAARIGVLSPMDEDGPLISVARGY